MTNTLAKLYDIFGQVVLIPVEFGTKKPVNNRWQRVSFADTQTKAYRAELETALRNGGNIGVVLGPASGGLVAIDIDSDKLAPDFLKLNPLLADTTRTRGKRGCQFFFRLAPGTSYPNSKACYSLKDASGAKYGEWRCGGGGFGAQSVFFGRHPDGCDYHFLNDKPVTTGIDFSQINWLAPWKQNRQHRLSQRHTGGYCKA